MSYESVWCLETIDLLMRTQNLKREIRNAQESEHFFQSFILKKCKFSFINLPIKCFYL